MTGRAPMEFRILGNLEVWSASDRVALGGPREHKLLAVLLVNANRVVAIDTLVDELWDGEPPVTARKQVRNVVSQLRSRLGRYGATEYLLADGDGYRCTVLDNAFDARVFQDRVARGSTLATAGDQAAAAGMLRSALALWRGPLLAGLSSPAIEAATLAWAERLLSAREMYFDCELGLGRHREMLPDLSAVVAENPLREKLIGLLMAALQRCGRKAEALALYRDVRTRMIESTGIEPCAELRDLQLAILSNDVTAPKTCRAMVPSSAPAQLPSPNAMFIGRDPEIDVLTGAVDSGCTTVAAITGTPGVGKTELAIHWAHLMRNRFPGGTLHVNLRGFDPSNMPVEPATALRGFIEAFAVHPERIPAAFCDQQAMYRDLLADNKVLVVLDNARDEAQVRPLLPEGRGSFVVVTSRQRMIGLAVTDGACLCTLGLLEQREAYALLVRRLSQGRVDSDTVAAAELVELCTGLPLALSIAAAHVASRSRARLTDLVAQLRNSATRLDTLGTGDPATDLRSVLSWSYRRLSDVAMRVFRLAGIAPGPEISAGAAASLADLTVPVAERALGELWRANLLTNSAPSRFTFHDLLRVYAVEQADSDESAGEQDAALLRVLDYYLHSAFAADRALYPSRDPITIGPPRPGVVLEWFDDGAAAVRWFEREHAMLLAAVRAAVERGHGVHAWQLCWAMGTFLHRRGRWADLVAVCHAALDAARTGDDLCGQAHLCRIVGRVYAFLRCFEKSDVFLRRAIDHFGLIGDHPGQARAQMDLAWSFELRERYHDALSCSMEALKLYEGAQHSNGLATTRNGIGWYLTMIGDYRQALQQCEQALRLLQALGDRYAEAGTWDSLGYTHHQLGDYPRALAAYQRAIELFRESGDLSYEAGTMVRLGDTYAEIGSVEAARVAWQQALSVLEEVDVRGAEAIRRKLACL